MTENVSKLERHFSRPEAEAKRAELADSLTRHLLAAEAPATLSPNRTAINVATNVAHQTEWLSVPGHDGLEISLGSAMSPDTPWVHGYVYVKKEQEGKPVVADLATWYGWPPDNPNKEGTMFAIKEDGNQAPKPIDPDSEEFQLIQSVYGEEFPPAA